MMRSTLYDYIYDCLRMSILAFLIIGLCGCSWFGIKGNEGAYLVAESIAPTQIPAGLDRPNFVDVMSIPNIDDVRDISGQEMELALPEPLSTTFGVDQIVLRKLGDRSWIFLDAEPASVWNKVKEFWEANNLTLSYTNAGQGVMETQWLVSETGDVDQAYESLKKGLDVSTPGDVQGNYKENRFRLELEPGVRNNSTEVSLIHMQSPAGKSSALSKKDWPEVSDDDALAAKLLSELAFYLGDNINRTSTVSLMAGNLSKTRVQLVLDANRPVLRYQLDFNRAWSTVGGALKSARIEVEDLNRTSAIYYVYYDDGSVDEPGFLKRLFTSDEKKPVGKEHRYQIHLIDQVDGVQVTVYKDDTTLAEAFIAERLLKVIKEFSS